MFNILQEDNQLVDLISYIGEPFPREVGGATLHPRQSLDSLDSSVFQQSGHTGVPEGSDISDDDISKEGPLVRVFLRPHEGVCSNEPFDIHPRQMVRVKSSK